MKTIINLFFTTVFVLLLAHFMPGVKVAGFQYALLVAAVLGLLNIFIKPILIILTLPATIFTLGLFLLVINAVIVMICDELIEGFWLKNFDTALVFSLVLSLCQALVRRISEDKQPR